MSLEDIKRQTKINTYTLGMNNYSNKPNQHLTNIILTSNNKNNRLKIKQKRQTLTNQQLKTK